MKHRCLDLEDLAALALLPRDDARRREAAACPRCDSLMAAAEAFLAGDAAIPEVELAEAGRRLGAAAPTFARRPSRSVRTRIRRAGAVIAAVAAVVAAVVVFLPAERPAPSGTVRGGGHVTGPAALGPVTVAAVPSDPAGRRLDWPPVAEADRYDVVLFSADLDTVAVVAAPDGPPVTVTSAGAAFARVRALAGGAPTAESPLVPLTLK